jgi:hypothetical protein
LELRQTALLGGRNIPDDLRALGRGDGVALDDAGLDLRHDIDDLVAGKVDLAGHQVVQHRRGPAIGDARRLGADQRLQHRAGGE